MGSEVSTESRKNDAPGIHITRTNSLKDVNTENDNCRKVGKPVKRSNTFSGLSGVRSGLSGVRPQITRRSKKENREACITEDACGDVTDGLCNGLDFGSEKDLKGIHDEDLFIPTKNIYGTSESTTLATTKPHTSKDIRRDTGVVQPAVKCSPILEQGSFDQYPTIPETNLTTYDSSGSDKESQGRVYHVISSADDTAQSRYKKRPKDDSNKVVADTNEHAGEKRKKVARSKSLVSRNKYVSVVEERYNSEMEDDDTSNRRTDGSHEDGVGARRTSDSYLLREKHVKRSEQFSAMLKQIRETRKPKCQQLSPYALGVIAGRASPQSPTPRPKHLKQNRYFDSWIKDQSERINHLAQALRGDEFKVNEFRSSFREQSNQWDRLPVRPNSDRLPRRRVHVSRMNMSSDTEDELDNKPFSGVPYGKPKSRSHDGEMLTKQLSETFFLLDHSFQNSKKDLPGNERSSGSSRSSVSNRISNSTLSGYGTLEERPCSSEVDNRLTLDS